MRSWDAVVELFASRKFIVLIVAQLAIFAPALAGKLNVDLAATIGTALAGVWLASHASQEKATIAAKASADSDAALAKVLPKVDA